MKKIFGIFLMVCMIFTNGLVVFAKEATEEITVESKAAESDRYVQIGEQASERSTTKVLQNFKNLQQTDSRWGNEVMQTCGKTIAGSGCCLTSFTMIQQYYGGTDNPAQVNAKMGNDACKFKFGIAAEIYGYGWSIVQGEVDSTYYTNYIKGAIELGNPVLVGMRNQAGGTHFVAAYGYDYNNIIISDPASRNYQLLSQYINEGYYVDTLCTYTK